MSDLKKCETEGCDRQIQNHFKKCSMGCGYEHEIDKLQSTLESERKRRIEAEGALRFYANIQKNHIFIFDDETSSRGEIYEKYKQHSIGDMGVKAIAHFEKYKEGIDE